LKKRLGSLGATTSGTLALVRVRPLIELILVSSRNLRLLSGSMPEGHSVACAHVTNTGEPPKAA
jgi:hypothetical protein